VTPTMPPTVTLVVEDGTLLRHLQATHTACLLLSTRMYVHLMPCVWRDVGGSVGDSQARSR
jgi:hypothetical protein